MDIINEKNSLYSDGFLDMFNKNMSIINEQLTQLNSLKKTISECNAIGICNACYKVRYITPSDVSTYITALSKLYSDNSDLGKMCETDINAITIAMVKKFIKDNNCVPFEVSTFRDGSYINPTMTSLVDLIMSCENDVYSNCVYSKWELNERVNEAEFVADVKRVNETYFMATMKRIVDNLPSILDKAGDVQSEGSVDSGDMQIMNRMFMINVEQFILFASTIYSLTLQSILDYAVPSRKFVTESATSDSGDETFMECAMVRTMDMELCQNAPRILNVRDVVLQDVTHGFKDTEAAIRFILSDARSPISIIIKRFGDSRFLNLSNNDLKVLGHVVNARMSRTLELDHEYAKLSFHTNVNWLDKLAYGNNFLNGNYRHDQVGNHHVDSIVITLDSLYKLYCGNELTTNEEIANNIYSTAGAINYIIGQARCSSEIDNVDYIRDVLCVLGEIMTRDMIKLYDINTYVADCSMSMDDVNVPGYLYNESFIIMEDGGIPQPTITVKDANGNTPATNGGIKQVVSKIISSFVNWVNKQLSAYGGKFNADHKHEVEWIQKNDKLNKEIAEAINNRSFNPNVSNLPLFDVPARELGDIKIDTVVKELLVSKEPINADDVKVKLYPQAISSQVTKMKDDELMEALTNYVLYKQIKPKPPYSGALSAKLWNEIIDDLLNTGKLIESQCKKTSDALKRVCNDLANKAREEEARQKNVENMKRDDTPQETIEENNRASQLLPIVQAVSKNYYVTTLNVLRSKFYAVNYKTYRDIVSIYKQQTTSVNQQSNAQTTPNTNTNNNSNPDDLTMNS